MNTLSLRRRQRLLPWLALLLLATLVGYRQVSAQFAAAPAAPELVAGSYAGTVLVSEPAPLGDLDLLLDITSVNGQLTGQVNPAKTQVFLGGPTFSGSVTTSPGITPTLRIESQTFSGVVSGRTVQRHFVLTGAVLDAGNELRGVYTETITGFKPQPMQVKGSFLLLRPNGVTDIITVPTPRGTPPATPTATSTVPPVNGNGPKLYLPLIQRAAVVNAAAVEEKLADDAPTFTPTATPTPTVADTLTLAALETPTITDTLMLTTLETPTPIALVLDASTGLTTTEALTATTVLTATEAQQQIHLPLIMH